jgi:hypothetical protein
MTNVQTVTRGVTRYLLTMYGTTKLITRNPVSVTVAITWATMTVMTASVPVTRHIYTLVLLSIAIIVAIALINTLMQTS